MKQLLSGAATRQVPAIVVGVLLAAYGLSAMVWLSFDMRPGPPPEFIGPASEIGHTLRLLAVLPAEEHTAVLSAIVTDGLIVQEGAGALPVLSLENTPQVHGLQHALSEELDLGNRVLLVGSELRHEGRPVSLDVLATYGLSADHWLLFRLVPRNRGLLRWLSPSGVASFIAVPIIVGLISLWAARRVTRPLVRLAAATEGVGALQDNPSPVMEEGTLEVRRVARAFNAVLDRLQRFVADRMEMLASISHDLRTPLTRLRLRAETLNDAEMRKKMLNDIRAMESMVTSTLAFIRDEAALEPIEQVDLGVLLQTVCDEFNDAGNAVYYQGPARHGVACRPQALQRALVNLIDNALKFDATVILRLEATPGGVAISIEDDGPGIPDTEKDDVFKPFFRGQRATGDRWGSVGLGLSIVKAIVESHQGSIELSDRVPQGLCVRLSIPVSHLNAGTKSIPV
jgi:signal transduction histidine kinase